MSYTSYIARRYLFSRKHISLISTLTSISIAGITIGTALLIVVLSVFNGFFSVIKDLLLSFDPDIRIEAKTGKSFAWNEALKNKITSIPEIQTVSPYAGGKCLVAHQGDQTKVVVVKGIHKEDFFQLNTINNAITKGNFDLEVKSGKPGLLMGEQLLRQLNFQVGEKLVLLSAAGMQKALTQFSGPRSYRFEIRGRFHLKKVFEGSVVFIDLKAAQRLFDYRNRVTGVDIKLEDHQNAEAVKNELGAALGGDFRIKTWYDLQKPLYDVMYLEKWGAFIILMLIVLVAVLNIVGSLTMIVLQKNRDIGILRTMGVSPSNIKKIFLKQGLFIGLIGSGLGGGLGLLLSYLQKEFGLIRLSESFIINAYPVDIQLFDIAIVLAGSLGLSLLASWYPSQRASRVEPADAIRYE